MRRLMPVIILVLQRGSQHLSLFYKIVMRSRKKPKHNPQAEYYHVLLKIERKKKALILIYIRKYHPKIFSEMKIALKDDADKRAMMMMKNFDLLL